MHQEFHQEPSEVVDTRTIQDEVTEIIDLISEHPITKNIEKMMSYDWDENKIHTEQGFY